MWWNSQTWWQRRTVTRTLCVVFTEIKQAELFSTAQTSSCPGNSNKAELKSSSLDTVTDPGPGRFSATLLARPQLHLNSRPYFLSPHSPLTGATNTQSTRSGQLGTAWGRSLWYILPQVQSQRKPRSFREGRAGDPAWGLRGGAFKM